MDIIALLVWFLVAAIVIYVVNLVVGMLALPREVKIIAMLIVGVIFLLIILQHLGVPLALMLLSSLL